MPTDPTPEETAAMLRAALQGFRVSDRTFERGVGVLLMDWERLRGIEQRAHETETWCGEPTMHRAVTYILTGETP